MKRTGPTNPLAVKLVGELKKEASLQKADLWKRIAEDIQKPSRQRRIVNLSRINRYAKSNETLVVPGKVLGSGSLTQSLTIAAFAFSNSAKQRIEEAKGKAITIEELMKQNPKGKNVRLIG